MKPPVKKAPKPKTKRLQPVTNKLVGDNKVKGRKPGSVTSSPAENDRLRRSKRPTSWPGGSVVPDSWGKRMEKRTHSDKFDFDKTLGPKAEGEHRQRVASNARNRAKKANLPKNGK